MYIIRANFFPLQLDGIKEEKHKRPIIRVMYASFVFVVFTKTHGFGKMSEAKETEFKIYKTYMKVQVIESEIKVNQVELTGIEGKVRVNGVEVWIYLG